MDDPIDTGDVATCLLGSWLHAREEDVGAARSYRPAGHQLPLSRLPRHALEFDADGSALSRSAGPADARVARPGRWELSAPRQVLLRWDDGDDDTSIAVDACDGERLVLTVLHGRLE